MVDASAFYYDPKGVVGQSTGESDFIPDEGSDFIAFSFTFLSLSPNKFLTWPAGSLRAESDLNCVTISWQRVHTTLMSSLNISKSIKLHESLQSECCNMTLIL